MDNQLEQNASVPHPKIVPHDASSHCASRILLFLQKTAESGRSRRLKAATRRRLKAASFGYRSI
ncbi:MAG TPA: hypothetical protein PKO15_19135, partial [Fibrobacteria bacterium]|nr:hypothetical protein [Fibrobacteria bacterium]